MAYTNSANFYPAESLTENGTESLFGAPSSPSNTKGVENQSY